MPPARQRPISRILACLVIVFGGWSLSKAEESESEKKTDSETKSDTESEIKSEKKIRDKFYSIYTASNEPERRSHAVTMLSGLKEKDSLRILYGLLGASIPEVRLKACEVMAETADPDGLFVKPLTGALKDKDRKVRVAAAKALGEAQMKSHAIKGLVFTFLSLSQKRAQDQNVAAALQDALVNLTGKRFDEGSSKEAAANWSVWWKENRERIEKADEELREKRKNVASQEDKEKGEAETASP